MSFFYDKFQLNLADKQLDMGANGGPGADVFKAELVKDNSNAESGRSTLEFRAGVTNPVTTGTGPIQTIGTPTLVELALNILRWDGNDITFTAVPSQTPQLILGLVIYEDVSDILVAFVDGSLFPLQGTSNDITIQWNSAGIGQWQAGLT